MDGSDLVDLKVTSNDRIPAIKLGPNPVANTNSAGISCGDLRTETGGFGFVSGSPPASCTCGGTSPLRKVLVPGAKCHLHSPIHRRLSITGCLGNP